LLDPVSADAPHVHRSQGTLRLVLAISLDGRLAPPEGGAAQLGGRGDRRALEQALAWADAALIGAGTLRAHRCTCLLHDQQLLDQRLAAGRSLQPTAVVVTGQCQPNFPADWPFFQQPLERWLLRPEDPTDPTRLEEGFDHLQTLRHDWFTTIASLAARGMERIVLLGGAQLTAALLQADVVDELQLTLTPRVLGGPHGWVPWHGITLSKQLADASAWALQEAVALDGDELLVRYCRRRSSS
jgi:5-amino-6-(5-phosphoribosylamino)uracil reductase